MSKPTKPSRAPKRYNAQGSKFGFYVDAEPDGEFVRFCSFERRDTKWRRYCDVLEKRIRELEATCMEMKENVEAKP